MFVLGFIVALVFFIVGCCLYLRYGVITLYLDKENFKNEVRIILQKELNVAIGNYIKDLKNTLPDKLVQEIIGYLQKQKINVVGGEFVLIPNTVLENLKPILYKISENIVLEQYSEEKINMFIEQITNYLGEEIERKIDSSELEDLWEIELLPKIKTRIHLKWS